MKTVQVPDDWCESCSGTGKRTLHGIAITGREWSENWDCESKDDYMAGVYDTMCEVCNGTGKVSQDDAADYYQAQADMRAEAPHMFQ